MFKLDHASLLHSRFCVVTQRSSPRDDHKNGYVADFLPFGLRKTAYEGDGGVFPVNLDNVACPWGTKICDFLYPIFRSNANV